MRISYPDYIRLVIETYKRKRRNNELSSLLIHPTYSKIKKECLAVYKHRFEKKDEKILNSFFLSEENGKSLFQFMKASHVDKFKPLQNYLLGKTERTDDKNVELLAWLIDFQHRPYVFDKDFILSDEELTLITNNGQNKTVEKVEENHLQIEENGTETAFKKTLQEQQGEINKEPQILITTVAETNSKKKKSKGVLIIILILVICTAAIYAIWQGMGSANTICAYWAGDRYQEVPCSEDPGGRLILTIDPEKVKSFKRITRVDTITELSIGKVYYIKDSNIIKYYTEGGRYPEDLTRNLRELSRYMFEKYLRKTETSSGNSLPIPKE